jgi:ribosomal protein S18 acetylase RimI-like enzyme
MKRRIANSNDADALNRLVNSAYRGDSSKRGWTTEADLLGGQRVDVEGLSRLLEDPTKSILVFENLETSQIHACVLLDFALEATDGDQNAAYLGMLTVDPSMQGQGLGKKMMAFASEFIQRQGRNSIIISVIQLRHELIAWYRRHGFEATGEAKPFPYGDERFGKPKRNDLHFLVFSKQLLNPMPDGKT